MPRKARLDAYSTLHHVMARGIERSPIFRSDKDRADLLNGWALLGKVGDVPNNANQLMKNIIIRN